MYHHSDWITKLEISDRISVAHKNGKKQLKGKTSAVELKISVQSRTSLITVKSQQFASCRLF